MIMFEFNDIHVLKNSNNIMIKADVSMRRFTGQFSKAQFDLDSAVMTGMIPYMPMVTSTFIDETKAMSAAIAGTGYVYAAAPPYGRFLYEGKTMVGESSGSTWAKLGEQKVLVSKYAGKTAASEELTYNKSAHPKVTDHWFDAAKAKHGKSWARLVKKTAGGGKRG